MLLLAMLSAQFVYFVFNSFVSFFMTQVQFSLVQLFFFYIILFEVGYFFREIMNLFVFCFFFHVFFFLWNIWVLSCLFSFMIILYLDLEKIKEFTELNALNLYCAPDLVQTGFTPPLVRQSKARGKIAPYRCGAKNTLIIGYSALCIGLIIMNVL